MSVRPAVFAGLSLLILAGSYACGSDVTEPEPEPTPGARPPGPPDNGIQGDGNGYTYGINKLFLGDTDRAGSPNPSAWRSYGYDIDGIQVDCKGKDCKDRTDLCTPRAGASASNIYPDGDNGIDNAFGKILMPIIGGFAPNATGEITDAIAQGNFTLMIDIAKLGTAPDYVDLLSQLYAGVQLVDSNGMDAKPNFDGNDEWPVAPELLVGGDINKSQVQFPTSYTNGHTWVSGSPGNIDLSIGIAGFSLVLSIAQATISMDIAPDRNGVTNGTISGVIPVDPLIEELKKIAGSFDETLCMGTTFESLADQIRAASDIMADGTQDPGQPCSAISIGLGFEANPIKLGAVADPAPPEPDPCNPMAQGGGGGTTTGGGSGGEGGIGTSGSTGGAGGN